MDKEKKYYRVSNSEKYSEHFYMVEEKVMYEFVDYEWNIIGKIKNDVPNKDMFVEVFDDDYILEMM